MFLFRLINRLVNWLTEADRELREQGYIVHYPPPGTSWGAPYVTYVGKPEQTSLNTDDNDRAGTISETNPGS